MITVSTTTNAEAEFVAQALEEGLPREVDYVVYLNGHKRAARDRSQPLPEYRDAAQ